jgi:hypothetical protein
MQQRTGGDHFGVQQRMPAQQSEEVATVPVSPVHHRRHGKSVHDALLHVGGIRHVKIPELNGCKTSTGEL